MAGTYSQRLFLEHAIVDTGFTVPVDATWVVRTVCVFWPGGEATPGAEVIDILTSATVWWDTDIVSIAGTFHHLDDVRIVLPPGTAYEVKGLGLPDLGLYGYALSPS